MAFDFPNPPTAEPVTNPETGITYKYDAPSQTWVVVASTVQDLYYTKIEVDSLLNTSSGVHEGVTPPVLADGDIPQLWYNTNTLELYFYYCDENNVCAWVPTAAPLTELASVKAELEATGAAVAVARLETAENYQELQQIKENLGNVTLQEVLDNDPIADKGAVFGGPVTVGFDEFDPQESHAIPLSYYDEGQAAQNEDIGNLQGSVVVLQQEIEALSQVVNKSVPHTLIRQPDDTQNIFRDGGFYFGDCPNGNLHDIPDDWSGMCFIYVDTIDNDGNFADFGPDTLDPGDLIEGVSATGYFLVEVGQGGYDEGAGKRIAGIQASLIKASGVPGPAGQEYALTAFRLNNNGGIDLPTADQRYVKKTGDKISGILETTEPIWIRPGDQGAKGGNNMLVVNQQSAKGQASILRVQQDGDDIIKVQYDKTTTFNNYRIVDVGAPTDGDDAANKQYVDDAVAGVKGGSGGLFEPSVWTLDLSMDRDETTKGKFYADDDDFYMSTSNANNLTWVPGAAGGRTTNAWVTIYSTAGKLMQTYEVNKIHFKEKYGKKYITEFEWAWHYSSSALVDGEQYKIIVPGFLT